MSDGYKYKNVVLSGQSQTVANATAAVTAPFGMSTQDSLYFLCKVVVASVTAGSGITAKLQESYDGSTWEDVGNRAQVSVTGNGAFEISMIATDTSDAAQLPIWPLCRVAVTAASDATATVTEVWVSRRS